MPRARRSKSSSVLALGNLGIEGATDLARENLIAAIALNPPAVRTVVYGALLKYVYTAVNSARACLFDDLISAQQNRWGYGKAEGRGGLAVHDHLKFCRRAGVGSRPEASAPQR